LKCGRKINEINESFGNKLGELKGGGIRFESVANLVLFGKTPYRKKMQNIIWAAINKNV
jgi:hypothetical protein